MFRRQSTSYMLLAIILDMLGTYGALALARYARDELPYGAFIPIPVEIPPSIALLTVLIWTGVFFIFSVYDPRRNARLLDEFQHVITASLFALLVFNGALYFFSDRTLSRLLIVYFFGLNLTFLLGWRLLAYLLMRALNGGKIYQPRRVLIIGANDLGRQVAAMLREYAWTGLNLVGFLDDERDAATPDAPILGSLDEAKRIVQEQRIHEVIITLPYRAYEKLNDLIVELQTLPLQVRVAPNYFNLALFRATVEDFSGMPLINLRDPALTPYQRLVKRAFDLIVGTALLIISIPLLIAAYVMVRLDTPGPAIFRQKRVGENGRLFTMYKFRTMYQDAEARLPDVIQFDEYGTPRFKDENDPRVTPVGKILRRTSIDELPQLINVLKGDMSLVGPRPEMPMLVEKYQPWQHKRFAIPQGMTGWWQINGRSTKPMHLHTEDDLFYIQNYSLLLDILILWRTVFAVIRRRGAF